MRRAQSSSSSRRKKGNLTSEDGLINGQSALRMCVYKLLLLGYFIVHFKYLHQSPEIENVQKCKIILLLKIF